MVLYGGGRDEEIEIGEFFSLLFKRELDRNISSNNAFIDWQYGNRHVFN